MEPFPSFRPSLAFFRGGDVRSESTSKRVQNIAEEDQGGSGNKHTQTKDLPDIYNNILQRHHQGTGGACVLEA